MVSETAQDGGHDPEVCRRFADLEATGSVNVDIASCQMKSEPLLKHCHQHGNSVVVDAGGNASSRAVLGAADQRLQLHQNRASPFQSADDGASGRGCLPLTKEQSRSILNRKQSPGRHFENTDFVGSPETILYGSDDAMVVVALPFEVEDGIDDMFQSLGPGDASVLGYVTYEEDGNIPALCQLQ